MAIPGNPWWNNRLESGATSDDGSVVITRYLDPLFVPPSCNITVTPPSGPPVHLAEVRVADLRSNEGVVVELQAAAELLFLLKASAGAPVSGGFVALSTHSDKHEFVDQFTRPIEGGRAVFAVEPGVRAAWCAVGAAGGIQSGTVHVDHGVTRVHALLDRESPAHDVFVRVRDPLGHRVETAKVTVFPDRQLMGPVAAAGRVAPWDAKLGVYAARVPQEAFPLRIMTFESTYGFGEDVIVERPDDVDVHVRLHPRGNLRVLPEVVDQFAMFRSGPMHVVVRNSESGRMARHSRLVGPWSLDSLIAGQYEVFVAMADGAYVGRARATVEAGQQSSVVVRLSISEIIEGRVRRNGAPQPGLTVQVVADPAWHGLPWGSCTTSETGSFRVTGSLTNVVTLAVLDRDGTLIREFTLAPGSTSVTLNL